ncbi:hypothetical protein Pmani_005318 [Petrolisthes manimaculis]|uniref:Apple domain-containing protein n=1 Tax=Petrolisthes manimaculis TaxID=1843537 RepID=A0AAE1QCP6_9EUCA|nr:hypothetical protein Pmani_005318 [Petrolisthes manimaculis]
MSGKKRQSSRYFVFLLLLFFLLLLVRKGAGKEGGRDEGGVVEGGGRSTLKGNTQLLEAAEQRLEIEDTQAREVDDRTRKEKEKRDIKLKQKIDREEERKGKTNIGKKYEETTTGKERNPPKEREGIEEIMMKGVRERRDFPRCSDITDSDNRDHPAPSYIQTLQGSFSMVVEMTYRTKNMTYYVEEAREVMMVEGKGVNTGAVHITSNGSKVAYYNYPDSGQFVEEMDGQCRLVGTDMPPFNEWGWWDSDSQHGSPLYGPSALFRHAYFTNKRYMGVEVVNGVNTEFWVTCQGNHSVDVYYYFSERSWEMPLGEEVLTEGDGRNPVRMEVIFLDTSERVQYNILEFTPFITKPALVETPRGESCEGSVSLLPDAPLPSPDSHFSFYQEVVHHSSIDGTDLGVTPQQTTKVKLTYSYSLSLVRYDYSPPTTTSTPTTFRVIHDYNTGVQYVVDENLGNCTRSRIPDHFFDDYVDGIFSTGGQMVSPDQLFHLDDAFTIVGPHSTRYDPPTSFTLGASPHHQALLWTSTRSDLPDPDTGCLQNFPKAVLEYYFTKRLEETWNGIEVVDVPVRADVFVYNSSDPTQVVAMRTVNIYDYSVVKQYVEDEFYVGECILDQDQVRGRGTSVFIIVFPANEVQKEAVTENIDSFRNQLVFTLLAATQISPTRILNLEVAIDLATPGRDDTSKKQDIHINNSDINKYSYNKNNEHNSIPNHHQDHHSDSNRSKKRLPRQQQIPRRDYGVTNSILATVRIAERAPYIFSYVEPNDDPHPVPGSQEEVMRGVTEAETCASLCSTHTEFDCRAFHQCRDTCYLSRVEGTDGVPDQSVEGCHLWVLSVSNISLLDPPTHEAFQRLHRVISSYLFNILLYYQDHEVSLSATEALEYDQLDPLSPLRGQFSLTASSTALLHPDTRVLQVANLDACFAACVGWKEYRCVTLSYRQQDSGNGGFGGNRGGGREEKGDNSGRGVGGSRAEKRDRGGGNGGGGGGRVVINGGQCSLSATHYADLNSSSITPDSLADLYSRLYLVEYDPVFGGVAINTSGIVYNDVASLDDCARLCTTEASISCQSFEYCYDDPTSSCHLHSEHFLDVVDGGNYLTNTSCMHFSSKTDLSFSQYPGEGWPETEHHLVARDTSASACAKLCIEDMEEVCESFDMCSACENSDVSVCGPDNKGMLNLCYLSTRHLGQPGATLVPAPHCRHYSREVFGDLDYPGWLASISTKPYTAEDMAWLGVAMVILGALMTLGFLALLVLSAPTLITPKASSSTEPTPMSYVDLRERMGESES